MENCSEKCQYPFLQFSLGRARLAGQQCRLSPWEGLLHQLTIKIVYFFRAGITPRISCILGKPLPLRHIPSPNSLS